MTALTNRFAVLRRLIVHLVAVLALSGASLFAFDIWLTSAGTPEIVPTSGALTDHLQLMQRLEEEQRIAEAIALGAFVEDNPDLPHHAEIVEMKKDLVRRHRSWTVRTRKFFVDGVFFGEGDSAEALSGALITDFLIIGDVRDLTKQGFRRLNGEEVDEVIVALSSVGLVSSVLTWTPEPTSSIAGVAAKPVITLLKLLRAAGTLSNGVSREIMRIARKVIKTRRIGEFSRVLSSFGGLMKHAPTGTTSALTRHAHSLDDVEMIAQWTRHAPNETVAILAKEGEHGVRSLRGLGTPTASKLRSLLRHGKVPARGLKAVRNGRIGQLADVIARWLMNERPHLRWMALALAVLSGILAVSFGVSGVRDIKRIIRGSSRVMPVAGAHA